MQNEIDASIQAIQNEKDVFARAKLIEQVLKKFNLRLVDLSKKLSIKPSYLCHILRLNRLPEIVIDGYYSKLIAISHLFIISRLKDPAQVVKAYENVLSNNLTVLQTDELVREMIHGIKTEGEYLNPDEKQSFVENIKALKKNIEAKITQTRIKGKLVLEIKGSPADSSRVLKRLMKSLEALKES